MLNIFGRKKGTLSNRPPQFKDPSRQHLGLFSTTALVLGRVALFLRWHRRSRDFQSDLRCYSGRKVGVFGAQIPAMPHGSVDCEGGACCLPFAQVRASCRSNASLQAVMALPSGERGGHVLTGCRETPELASRYKPRLRKTTSADGSAGCPGPRGISPRCGGRL